MKKLLVLLVLLVSGFVNGQNIITIIPDLHQNMSAKGNDDVFDIIDSETTLKCDKNKPHDDVMYIFDLDNKICDFFRFGELVSSVPIVSIEKKNGLLYLDCDDTNIRTGGEIVTHYILNPDGKKGVPHMIYHFYWDDIDTSVAEVTLTLK
jgi:hypothetical protein